MDVVRIAHALRGDVAKLALLTVLAAGLSVALSTDGPAVKRAPVVVAQHPVPLRPKFGYVRKAEMSKPKPAGAPSAFAKESAMSYGELMDRWNPFIKQASHRFGIPVIWIRAVMMIESGGRTMLAENTPITSSAGAMGLMQVMPKTWHQMRRQYRLGSNPYDPRDNIMAGTAYMESLYHLYGYPGLFAAYNDGPNMLEAHRRLGQFLPNETTAYVLDIAGILSTGTRPHLSAEDIARFTPESSPVQNNPGAVASIRVVRPRAAVQSDDDEEQ